jgi:hypothetical protein
MNKVRKCETESAPRKTPPPASQIRVKDKTRVRDKNCTLIEEKAFPRNCHSDSFIKSSFGLKLRASSSSMLKTPCEFH